MKMDDSEEVTLRPKSDRRPVLKKLSWIRAKNVQLQRSSRQDSIGAIEELIQCGICLEKLDDSRMLPCQHTFCLACLQSHLMARNMATPQPQSHHQQSPSFNQAQIANPGHIIKCPVCQHKVQLEKGMDSIEALPRNLYIDSLLKVVEGNLSPTGTKVPDYRCSKCQTVSKEQEQCCQHCLKIFCNICWNEHLSELESNLSLLVKQVDESNNRLEHKLENFQNRCEQLKENIKEAAVQKINTIRTLEESALGEVDVIKNEGRLAYDNINTKIAEVKQKLISNPVGHNKVSIFMSLHQETSRLLKEVNRYGETRIIFDPTTFKLDQDTEGIYNDTEEADPINGLRVSNPFDNEESMTQYYKTRSFTPKLIWNKCPRPAHVGVPPWDSTLLYVAATDTHTVLILDRDRGKLKGRLTSPNMLYPHGIAFSKHRQEIYVSDKWQHCIHVFSSTGEYQRQICSKGNGQGRVRSPDGLAMGPKGELVICDTGNQRVILVNPQTGDHISTIGLINGKTALNIPTGIAVFHDKIIVADTGNNRIKTFNFEGEVLQEFGALGRHKGQFRSAEVVAVDPMGFILVGDAGNARVQVFKPDGTLVKVFGGDGFMWMSGLFVTSELDIITTDSKSRSLRMY